MRGGEEREDYTVCNCAVCLVGLFSRFIQSVYLLIGVGWVGVWDFAGKEQIDLICGAGRQKNSAQM